MSEILELPLASIEVGTDRARDLDPAWAEGLAGSIREQGLMQPIVVRRISSNMLAAGAFGLVAGLHRLEAFRLLGRETIPAVLSEAETADEAKLAEVMENLARNELIALDRCHHLFELKQVWERLYPQAANGKHVNRGNQHTDGRTQSLRSSTDAGEIFGFARANAEHIGLSKRSIEQAVKIWTTLVPTVRKRLRGTDLARKQTELKALSELSAAKQIKVLDAILNDELEHVGNVAQALAHLEGTIACDPLERRFAQVSRSIADLDDETFDHVIAVHEDRVLTSLKRRGRI